MYQMKLEVGFETRIMMSCRVIDLHRPPIVEYRIMRHFLKKGLSSLSVKICKSFYLHTRLVLCNQIGTAFAYCPFANLAQLLPSISL